MYSAEFFGLVVTARAMTIAIAAPRFTKMKLVVSLARYRVAKQLIAPWTMSSRM